MSFESVAKGNLLKVSESVQEEDVSRVGTLVVQTIDVLSKIESLW